MAFGSSPRRPQKASDILKALLRRKGIDQELDRYEFVLHWQEIVGAELAKVCKPEAVRGSTLWIQVPNSAWASELSFQASIIMGRVNKYQKSGAQVKEVRFKVG